MKPNAVLLFAAGLGTRMAPLTDTQPKPMVQVDGKPLIDHALEICDGLRRVVNAHYLADQIVDHLKGREISISDETDQLLETGGGLKRALPLLGTNPVITMNTDAVWRGPNPISTVLEAWGDTKTEALQLLIPQAHAIGHTGSGDFDIGHNGALHRGTDYIYSGVQIIKTDRLKDIEDDVFSMWRLWEGMLERGTLHGVVYTGRWCDVGRPDSIPLAEAMLRDERDV